MNLRFWRDRTLELQLRIESDLRNQIVSLNSRIEKKDREIELLNGKIDRMETVLMPLGSQAGAMYVRSMNPSAPRKPGEGVPMFTESSWQKYLKDYMKHEEELERKEKDNGVQKQ